VRRGKIQYNVQYRRGRIQTRVRKREDPAQCRKVEEIHYRLEKTADSKTL
jgi:hypothetical protein